jgi:hypothetical protein
MVSRLPVGRRSICNWCVAWARAVPCNCWCASRAPPPT